MNREDMPMSGSIAAIMLTYATAQRPCLETTLADQLVAGFATVRAAGC
jgi:hypothetical protein